MSKNTASPVKLTRLLKSLMLDGCKTAGTYNPAQVVHHFEERMTLAQVEAVTAFLSWCHTNNKGFSRTTIDACWSEFKAL